MKINRFFAFATAIVGVAFFAATSEAAFKIRISDGTTTKTIVDGGVDDAAAASPGTISFTGTVGHISLTITSGKANPAPGFVATPYFAKVDLNVGSVAVDQAGTYTFELTDTGYNFVDLPYAVTDSTQMNDISSNGTATFQSIIDMRSGGANEFTPVGDINGTTVVSLGAHGPFDIDDLAVNKTTKGVFTGTSPISITQIITLTFTGAGDATSLDFKTTVTTPAPGGLIIALSGLAAVGTFRLRRKMAQA